MKKNKENTLLRSFLLGNKAAVVALIVFVVLSFISPIFLTKNNLINVLKQVCTNVILACGFTIVLGAGMIDLSVGSIMGFSTMAMGMLFHRDVPMVLAVLIGMLVAVGVGVINAFFITTFKLPAFIVTMAMQQILRGMIYIITGMIPIQDLPEAYVFIGQGNILFLPTPVWCMIAVVIIVWIFTNRTKTGRYILAIGSNKEAARVSGVNVNKIIYKVYIYTAVCSAFAGIVSTGRTASVQPSTGYNMEMNAIAAAVIGGTSMDGGSVNVVGALLGGLLVGLLNNGLNLMRVDSNWQIVTKGALILLAVLLDAISRDISIIKTKKRNKMEKN